MKLVDYRTAAEFQAEVERRATRLNVLARRGRVEIEGYGEFLPGTHWAEAALVAIDHEDAVLDIVGEG